MSLRLKLASIWLPQFILKKEFDKVAVKTINGLDQVLRQYTSFKIEDLTKKDETLRGNLEKRRSIMSKMHNERVKILINELGYENAIKLARRSLFSVGVELGHDAKRKLGVSDNIDDLILAAKILYKILGINFKIETKGRDMLMLVDRCSLSNYYTPEACIVLSAADEGVVRGLNPKFKMQYKERITEGAIQCKACIEVGK